MSPIWTQTIEYKISIKPIADIPNNNGIKIGKNKHDNKRTTQ
jgi:hypothetical protein